MNANKEDIKKKEKERLTLRVNEACNGELRE